MDIIYIIFGIILVLWGLFLCYCAIKNIIILHNQKTYPSVIGSVISTKVFEIRGGDDPTTWGPEVRYSYIVNGVTYESSNFCFTATGSENSWKKAKAIIDKYPVNGSVKVYYMPDNPKNSAIKLGRVNSYIVLWAIFGPLMLASGLTILLRGWGIF